MGVHTMRQGVIPDLRLLASSSTTSGEVTQAATIREVAMAILKNERNRFTFLIGRQAGLRSTSDIVEQLQAQIEQLQQQLKFNGRA